MIYIIYYYFLYIFVTITKVLGYKIPGIFYVDVIMIHCSQYMYLYIMKYINCIYYIAYMIAYFIV